MWKTALVFVVGKYEALAPIVVLFYGRGRSPENAHLSAGS